MDSDYDVGHLRLWISYPWMNKEERDFGYLVGQLKEADIEATYDSLQLLPDMHLSERTLQRLLGIGFDGWLYILTHQCFTRKACTDQLTAAIEQAVLHMGPEFPMVGLLYGISTQNVPAMLRVRPCISLADSDWKQQLAQVFRHRSSQAAMDRAADTTRFVWRIHPSYGEDPSMTAVEVCSKDESVPYWRFAIPKSAQPVHWGQGPSGGREISHIRFSEATGSGRYRNRDVVWFGAANIISNTESAYAVFSGPLPEFVCFGAAQSPFGPPKQMEIYWTALSNKTSSSNDLKMSGTKKNY